MTLPIHGPRHLPTADAEPVAWLVSDGFTNYEAAVAAMEQRATRIADGIASECVWLVEHAPLYTAGTSARDADLLDATRFPVVRTGRGGQYTYHGPGQRVAYVMLDVARRGRDVRAFVAALEDWVIASLARLNVRGEQRRDRVGVWVRRPDKAASQAGEVAEDKIATIGVRLRRWVSFHGLAVNIDPDLSHFRGIVPCGIADPLFGVTSLHDLGLLISMPEFDGQLRAAFEQVFGSTCDGGIGPP